MNASMKKNLFCDIQSDFRTVHICLTAINLAFASWKYNIYKGNKVGSVFLDLEKAFDTIDRNRLMKQLYNYAIKDTQ